LMPKLLFLNALSIGKKETPQLFKAALDSLVANYPQSDVSAMAKDILALMKQGQEAKTGTTSGSLLSRREETTKAEINEISPQQFSTEKQTKHRLLLINSLDKENMNKLLYNIASFNFSRFMIKDFDLLISKLDTIQNVLSVTNFESFDEANWYVNTLKSDEVLTKLLNDFQVQKVIISEDNYALIKTGFTLKDYYAFLAKPMVNNKNQQITTQKPTKKPEKSSIIKETVVINSPAIPVKTETPKPMKVAENKKIEKPTEVIQPVKPIEKQNQNVASTIKKDTIVKTIKSVQTAPPVPVPVVVKPKEPEAPLFKGLFGYKADEPHFIAIYVVSGSIDYLKTKSALDVYNTQNYALMNLKVSLETIDKVQVIIIGSLSNAQVAKSYLLRMVKEKSLFDGLKGSTYRNLLGSQKNLNTLIQKNALNQYFDFMQEYYLK
jgi:hypothetical protein